jgi:hypothetical protein
MTIPVQCPDVGSIRDGKTLTANYTGTNANGQQINVTAVYDKQQ